MKGITQMFYLYVCANGQERSIKDILIARCANEQYRKALVSLARDLNACESYIMSSTGLVVWTSWKGWE